LKPKRMSEEKTRRVLIPPGSAPNMLKRLPKLIRRSDALVHMEMLGHSMVDITTPEAERAHIKCPIYWDNAKRDIVFNNYLCSCGRLFMFMAKIQFNGQYNPGYNLGVCPCDVCAYFTEGIGCTYDRTT